MYDYDFFSVSVIFGGLCAICGYLVPKVISIPLKYAKPLIIKMLK